MTPWTRLPALALTDDEVHLFTAVLDQPEETVRALGRLLAPDELRRAGQFRFARDGRRFVVGRAYLREILAAALGGCPAELRFQYGAYGKPTLAAPPGAGASFNLAHTGDHALYALTRSRAVGVDLESPSRPIDIAALARRYMEPAEHTDIEALPEAQRRAQFFRFWTRREAYLKASGSGLAGGLDGIMVEPLGGAGAHRVYSPAAGAQHWTLHDLRLEGGLVGALVVAGHDYRIVVHGGCVKVVRMP